MTHLQTKQLLKSESNRALERQTTYMSVSWQSNLIASQKICWNTQQKAKSAIVNAMS